MQHVAIMKKSWGLTSKILSGEKTIESRWYKVKYKPWDVIKVSDTVYFKDTGEMIKTKAKVKKVIQFSDLTPPKVKEILNKYGKSDGIKTKEKKLYFKRFKNKQYCILIFLKNVKKVKPFHLNKTGFGTMSAWITAPAIPKVKKN